MFQPAAAHIEHVSVESAAQAFRDKSPSDGRACDAWHQEQRRAGPAEAQIVLTDAIRVYIAAIHESALHR
jgi:hypothetical protein